MENVVIVAIFCQSYVPHFGSFIKRTDLGVIPLNQEENEFPKTLFNNPADAYDVAKTLLKKYCQSSEVCLLSLKNQLRLGNKLYHFFSAEIPQDNTEINPVTGELFLKEKYRGEKISFVTLNWIFESFGNLLDEMALSLIKNEQLLASEIS